MKTLKKGDRISNYLLEEPVGAGSFGEVGGARHHVFKEAVAIKVPTDPQYVRNMQREGSVIHGLRHENIVRAIDMDPYDSPPYLVMEYIDGPSLREVIDKYGRTLPVGAAVVMMRGILRALSSAHAAGVVHRDIKPGNILLDHSIDDIDGIDESAVKVTDFGLGRISGITTQSILQSGSILTEDGKSISGTLAYMAPEQREGLECDGRSDLYACGIVLFEMLTGERPQGGEVPGMLRQDVPSQIDNIFRRCYTRLERRFASAEEMMAELDTVAPPRAIPQEHHRMPPPVPGGTSASGPRCPKCATRAESGDQFCIACGAQLVEAVPRCSSCGAYVHRDDKYCILCGHDLRVLAD